MMDFTIKKYSELIRSFLVAGYQLVGVNQYLTTYPDGKVIVLRHDVDEQPQNALNMARVEASMGVNATYYFRRVRKSDHPDIIRAIKDLGHEIGYHYEDLSMNGGEMERAIQSFGKNLEYFRQYYPVQTVCMHGSSSSQYDNRAIWEKVRLEDYGLIGEPYLSFDFNTLFYLTDTGYSWDGGKYAVRDIVRNRFPNTYHTTDEIIAAVNSGQFAQQAMILAHTLWTDNLFRWGYLHLREFARNRVKLLSRRNRMVAYIYGKLVSLYWGKS